MTQTFRFLSDAPIESTEHDELGFEPIVNVVLHRIGAYAAGIAATIEGAAGNDTKPEFEDFLHGALFIGVEGSWGTGKTSFMRMLRKSMTSVVAGEKKGGGENPSPETFLQKTCKRIGRPSPAAQDSNADGGRQDDSVLSARCVWINPWKFQSIQEIRSAILAEVLQGLPPDVLEQATRHWAAISGVALDSFFNVLGAGRPVKELRGVLPRESFAHEFDEPFRIAIRDHLARQWKKAAEDNDKWSIELFVVFIDDLDRCSHTVVNKVLEALKLYLDLPCCVFVLGYAEQRVAEALGETHSPEGTSAAEKLRCGREYLLKHLSSTVALPAPSLSMHHEYVARRLFNDKVGAGLEKDSNLSALLQTLEDRSPRLIKRIINGMGTRLLAHQARNQPAKLARLLALAILREKWPELMRALEAHERVLERLLGAIEKQEKSSSDGKETSRLDDVLDDLLGTRGGLRDLAGLRRLLGAMAAMRGGTQAWDRHLFATRSLVDRYDKGNASERNVVLVTAIKAGDVEGFNGLYSHVKEKHRATLPVDLSDLVLASSPSKKLVLDGIDFAGVTLRKAKLEHVSLRGADLRGADLTGGSLSGADLKDAKMQGTILNECSVAGLYREDLKGAIGYSEQALRSRQPGDGESTARTARPESGVRQDGGE